MAFDVSRKTFRAAEYPEYKAGRSATPTEFSGQLPLLREVLDALRIRHVGVEGFEADDVIATLTHRAVEQGHEVVICTGDRDAFQLVNDKVTLIYPVRGVSEVWRMDPAAVTEKYLVPPERYSDLAALVGETSDNLPGVPGVGPKTAAKWLGQYGDLAGVVAHVDEIKGKAGESLREHLDGVLRNRRLNKLVDDLDLPLSVDDLERQSWDREEVHRVFDGLEFRVLRERLFATFEVEQDEVEGGFELEGEVFTADDLAVRFGDGAVGRTAAARRGRRRPATAAAAATPASVALAGDDGSTAYLDLTALTREQEDALAGWLADPDAPKVLHDAKEQLQALSTRGLTLAGITSDTALAAYLVRPDQRSFDLEDLVVRHLGRELKAEEAAGDQGMLDFAADDDTAARDAMVRARAVLELSAVLHERLDETGGTELLRDLELPLVEILARMERTGIAVDEPALAELEADFAAKMRQAQQDAYDAIGRQDVNLGSPKQLQEVLFDQLGMPKTKRTKTGYTTDADALADLFAKTEHPFLEALLRHRDTARLRVTVEGLIKSVAPDRRIHTTYIQTIAATGRLSSTDPNLQNVPIRTEEGRRIREVFVVGEGYESLMSADYSQIEMRIMAHLSGDEGLIEAFRTGEDLHRFVGARVFHVEPGGRHPGDAQQGQGDELRPGLRPVGVRAVQAAHHLHRRGAGPDGRVLRPVRRGARLPARGRGRGPRHRLHRHDARSAPLPARPHQRQPAAPRGRRADGAQRAHPGLGGRHHQARDEGRRRGADHRGAGLTDPAPGARRARARGGAGGARGGRGAGPPRDGCGRRDGRAARRQRGGRSELARRRALTPGVRASITRP